MRDFNREQYFGAKAFTIGLNKNQTIFPDYLDNVISLSLKTGEPYDIEKEFNLLSEEIIKHLEALKRLDFRMIDRIYHHHLYRIYIDATFRDSTGIFRGRIIGTMGGGQLIIEDDQSKIRTYSYKEVEFL